MNEKLIERKLVAAVGKLGGKAVKFSSSFYTGYPDREVLMPRGRVYWVELKTTGKKPTEKQLERHRELRSLGFQVFTIDSQTGIDDFLRIISHE